MVDSHGTILISLSIQMLGGRMGLSVSCPFCSILNVKEAFNNFYGNP